MTFGAADYDQVQFAYDAMDRMIARIDQSNQRIGYAFDLAGRMITRSYPDNQNDSFTYDAASRMLSASSARYANTVSKTYNSDGTLASETLSTGGKNYPVVYGYDAANRNTSITYPSGKVVTRAYDPRGLLTEVQYNSSNVISRSYDNGGRLSSSTYGNGVVETRTYRSDNLLASIVGLSPGLQSPIYSFSYTWDANKNKTGESDGLFNAYSWTTGATGYDAEDRLIGWSRNNGESGAWNLSKVGDWNSVATNGITETRSHNAVHELLARDANSLSYDARGNLLTKDETGSYYSSGPGITTPAPTQTTWTYTWDFDNRLQHATDSEEGRDIEYRYDALGRRVSKIDHTETTDATIFVSSLNQEIAEYKESSSLNSATFDYVFGSYIDEVLMRVKPPISTTLLPLPSYYHADAQYSVRAITNRDAEVVERNVYDPYGAAKYLTSTGTLSANQASVIGNTILYTGRRLDTETGLYYFRARYYDSKLGRFIGRDPIGYEGSEWSLYEYVGSRPMVFVDPTGRKPSCILKSVEAFRLVNDCSFVEGADFGYTFASAFEFDDQGCNCECCEFRQYVLRYSIKASINTGGKRPQVFHVADFTGPAKEDCRDEDGEPVIITGKEAIDCYGDKTVPEEAEAYENCGFSMNDSPSFDIEEFIKRLKGANPNRNIISYTIELDTQFLQNVIDVCNGNNVVWAGTYSKRCVFDSTNPNNT